MKKLVTLLCLTVCTFHVFAQEEELLKKQLEKIQSQLIAASQKQDFKQAKELTESILTAYSNASPSAQEKYAHILANTYYNLACYNSLEKNKKEAIIYFEKAIKAGYHDYKHSSQDTDLDFLRPDKQFKSLINELKEKTNYVGLLQKSGRYKKNNSQKLPAFTYQATQAPALVLLKQKYNLDSIAGKGEETQQMKNLLLWVHNTVRHDGSSTNPASKNAVDLIEVCQKENRGINCRMMATILNEVYLAQGFPSRVVTCNPKDTTDTDCHVINAVWSKKFNKWLWMDPTFNAYVADEKGALLSIEEVRARLISKKPLALNKEANWNNQQPQTKEYYLETYMAKNLYWIQSTTTSQYNHETDGTVAKAYINLYPGGFNTLGKEQKAYGKTTIFATNDATYFWQAPVMPVFTANKKK